MSVHQTDVLSIAEFSQLFGFPVDSVVSAVETQRRRLSDSQAFYSVAQLRDRWSCSKAQVYSILQSHGVKVLNIGQGEKRKKVLVPAETVARIEKSRVEKIS